MHISLLSLLQVYQQIEKRVEQAITIRISYLEIYNEAMFDLLSTLPEAFMGAQQMTITEDEYGVSVKGLTVHISNNEEEALNVLFEVSSRKGAEFTKYMHKKLS